MVNAIERLRALYERVEMDESVGVCLTSRVEALNFPDALAAVDALHQAAKDAEAEGSSPQGMTEETHRALAAAVRRVEGQA